MELTDILQYVVIVAGILAAFTLIWRLVRRIKEKDYFEGPFAPKSRYRRRAKIPTTQKKEDQGQFYEERKQRELQYPQDRVTPDFESRLEPVRFHALWRRFISLEEWHTLLVYIFYGQRGFVGAKTDFIRRMTAPAKFYDNSSSMSRKQILRGTQISIYPELYGFRFNPPYANVLWLEDWHCIEFRMQALHEMRSHLNKPIEGRVAFYVGPILIGETRLFGIITDEPHKLNYYQSQSSPDESLWRETWTSPYRAIFVSYSHEDSYVVDQLELAYRALGDEYLRDISVLRSGENWNPALLAKINDANVFQLCWSEAAKRSQYVEKEWQHALGLQRRNFIRPMYWQIPMPKPPNELSDIHFAYIRINDDMRKTVT